MWRHWSRYCFRQRRVASSSPCHYLNQWCFIVYRAFRINFNEIRIKIHNFYITKMFWKCLQNLLWSQCANMVFVFFRIVRHHPPAHLKNPVTQQHTSRIPSPDSTPRESRQRTTYLKNPVTLHPPHEREPLGNRNGLGAQYNIYASSWWRHQMETFSALLAICAGNSPVPGEFPTQRPVARSFDVIFDLRLNKRLSKQWRGWWFETLSRPLWRHRNVVQLFLIEDTRGR